MKVFFASSHELSIPIANELVKLELVDGFITSPDKPTGRNRDLSANTFSQWASTSILPTFKPNSDEELNQLISSNNLDLIVTCAYGKIIRSESLSLPKLGWLNIHFSELPKYRGAAPAQRALMNGEVKTGISIFKLDAGLDTGPLLYTESYKIPNGTGAKALLHELSLKASIALPNLLRNVNSWEFKNQVGEPTFAPKISKDENRILWNSTGEEIVNQSRGLEINGGVHCFFRGEKVAIFDLSIVSESLSPGSIRIKDGAILVGTASNAISFGKIKPAGKNLMSVSEWLNGARISNEDRFE